MDIPAGQRALSQNKNSQKLFSNKFCDCDGLASSVPRSHPLENLWGIIKAQIKKDKPQKLDDFTKNS